MKVLRKIILTIIICCIGGYGAFHYEVTHQYTFELLGPETVDVAVFGEYHEPGYEAKRGEELLNDQVTSTTVNTSVVGKHTITYRFVHDDKEDVLTRTVNVVDTTPPTITIKGGDVIEWQLRKKFNDLTVYETSDNYDQNVEVTVTNNVDVNKEGTYEETFTAKDASGNTATATRKVIVSKSARVNNGVAVCMYHYLYHKDKVPENVNANYISVEALNEEIDYLKKANFYFPTFDELRAFVDGKLSLPGRSIILTFDDGVTDTLKLLSEVANTQKVPITSFMITSKSGEKKRKKYESEYLTFQSHTHDMHHGGGTIGHGGIMTALSVEEAVKDLQTSIDICGHDDALAYPYGDTNETSCEAAKQAGFKVAFTTQYGQVKQGSDPYLLPRVRMSNNQSLQFFKNSVN